MNKSNKFRKPIPTKKKFKKIKSPKFWKMHLEPYKAIGGNLTTVWEHQDESSA